MNKEICFKIYSKELFLEQVLIEYNKVPIYFVCKDVNNQFYIVLCTDIDCEKYIITKTQISKLIKLLTQKITMRDLILSEKIFWDVSAGENIEDDTYEQKNISLISLEDLPYENSYFKVNAKAHKQFLSGLESLFFLQTDEWKALNAPNSSNELECLESSVIGNKLLSPQVEIKETKSIEETVSLHIKSSFISYNDSFVNIGKSNQKNINHQLQSKNLTNNNALLAA